MTSQTVNVSEELTKIRALHVSIQLRQARLDQETDRHQAEGIQLARERDQFLHESEIAQKEIIMELEAKGLKPEVDSSGVLSILVDGARIPLPYTQTTHLLEDDVQWIVNSRGELGVKIGNQFFFLYKGDSLCYGGYSDTRVDGVCLDTEGPRETWGKMKYRPVGKREFGVSGPKVEVNLGDSDKWQDLPAAPFTKV